MTELWWFCASPGTDPAPQDARTFRFRIISEPPRRD
jgi:hypothetical protein